MTLGRLGAFASVTRAATLADADVDPDCFAGADSFVCHKGRVEDAKLVEQFAAPVLARYGWSRSCVTVQFIRGDEGRPDTLMVSVNGPKGGRAPSCLQPPVEKLTDAEVRRILSRGGGQQDLMQAIGEKSSTRGAREAATSAQLREIGAELKAAILAAPSITKARLTKNTGKISLGSGYGAEADIPLP